MELVYSGKVRDLYADGDDLIMVASLRVRVYDVVLPTPIPDKGRVLTQLSLWWFEQPGRPQRSLDKQFLRDWSASLDWDRRPPGPAVPPDVVAATRQRYLEPHSRLTPAELDG